MIGKFTNSNPEAAKNKGGKLSISEDLASRMTFKKANSYRQGYHAKYTTELNGLTIYQVLLHNEKLHSNTTLYNNWNFTSTMFWDGDFENSLWWSPDTTIVYTTENFKIGS
jgi:hypothetical protein